MKFHCEEITESEMGFWRRATAQVVLRGPAQSSLGRLKTGGHKVWEWQVQESKGRLYHQSTTVLLCTGIFGGDDTSTSELFDLEG